MKKFTTEDAEYEFQFSKDIFLTGKVVNVGPSGYNNNTNILMISIDKANELLEHKLKVDESKEIEIPTKEPSFEEQLNIKFKEEFGYLEKELNRWCVSVETNPYDKILVPTIDINLLSATIKPIYHKEDIFNLNPTIVGGLKYEEIDSVQFGDFILIRGLLGYAGATKFVRGDRSNVTLLVYQMLEKLKKLRGFGPDEPSSGTWYGTFDRSGPKHNGPGNDGFFQNSENSAAYELRLFSSCRKIEVKR
jgi:hypothetical protein